MIGKITGLVDYVAEDHALIEAGGVGYVVACSRRTLAGLKPGRPAALYTEFVVREDAMLLFGFPTLAEREWHRLLTGVQGVGARVALGVLGALGPEAVGRALALGDATAIRAAPGVGPKLAARIVNELRDKAPAVMALGAAAARPAQVHAVAPSQGAAPGVAEPAPPEDEHRAASLSDALSALTNLGYGEGEAAAAVSAALASGAEATPQGLIRAALKALAAQV
ncbi:MAG: Holliday junction branch migration protein RuvA [Rubrimonas sp.]|uniref:Holliday junction branch migration protein RuvA n=1 Tax=Rubrimonas sp. TaxID=2036015 RepID=UPI002FDE639D